MTPPNGSPVSGDHSAVSAKLADASARYEALPDDVAMRLDRVLDGLPPLEPPASPVPVPVPVPWWRRGWVLAGATSGVAVVFVGTLFFAMSSPPSDSTIAEAPADHQEQENSADDGEDDGGTRDGTDDGIGTNEVKYIVTYSGHDYGADGLAYALSATPGTVESISPVLGPIASDPVKLDTCATGAQKQFGGTVTAIDFGTFDGAPAVIVVVESGDGHGTIVAQRPACADVGYDAYDWTAY